MDADKPAALQAVMTGLYWIYDRVVSRSAASDAMPLSEKDIDRMIRRTATQAGAVGFTTNLGGLLTLPIALPANLAAVSTLQIKLISDIARARGYDVGSEQVRTLTVACLAGSAVLDILKDVGVGVGMRMSQKALLGISGAVLGRINQAVAGRLVTVAGRSGAVTVARVVPFIGGAISGTVDGLATAAVGAAAKRVFVRAAKAAPADAPALLPAPGSP